MGDLAKAALIIGASGQVGHQLANLLAPGGVVLTSRVLRPGWQVLDLATLTDDPGQASAIFEHDIAAVYCVGAATDVEGCESNPELAERSNAIGPALLAAAFKHVPFVYFSSDYVFDGREGPYREQHQANPISAYGKSKLHGEQLVLQAHPKALVIRTTGVYGSDPHGRNFPAALAARLKDGNQVRVPVDQFATPTHNEDLARATVKLVEAGASGVFHACGAEVLSRYQWAVVIATQLGLDPERVVGCDTLELKQRALRPMHGGLISEKLLTAMPGLQMRGATEGVLDWARSIPAPPGPSAA